MYLDEFFTVPSCTWTCIGIPVSQRGGLCMGVFVIGCLPWLGTPGPGCVSLCRCGRKRCTQSGCATVREVGPVHSVCAPYFTVDASPGEALARARHLPPRALQRPTSRPATLSFSCRAPQCLRCRVVCGSKTVGPLVRWGLSVRKLDKVVADG